MANTIEKNLVKARKESFDTAQEKKEPIKLLMETSAVEERNILREAGLDFNIREVEKKVGVNMVRTKKEEELGSKVFTYEEIESTCIKYGLRFLSSKRYKGAIEPTLGKTILEFFKEKNINAQSYEANNNLYIMAPSKAFNLDERPDPPPVDPVMFYKMSTNEGDMYALVHKWGKDFTIFRRIIGAVRETSLHWGWFKFASFFIMFSTITALMNWAPLFILGIIANLALAGVLTGITFIWHAGIGSPNHLRRYRNRFTKRNWNSTDID